MEPIMTEPILQPEQNVETVRRELVEKEEKLRKLVRQLDQLARTEFRDRDQRLKEMRKQRADLEGEIDQLKATIKEATRSPDEFPRSPDKESL
ncbi:MAG: hypothetical protein LC737_03835 [Chloroflexi bacterium]|nr:hypothetical protein [Chloroflexota bacterium]